MPDFAFFQRIDRVCVMNERTASHASEAEQGVQLMQLQSSGVERC